MKKLSKISLLSIFSTFVLLNPVFANPYWWTDYYGTSSTGPMDVIVWIFIIIIAIIACSSCSQG